MDWNFQRNCSNKCGTGSLLMWECGLKLRILKVWTCGKTSLLMWECGLKHCRRTHNGMDMLSLLMWECGLKLRYFQRYAFVQGHSLCGSVDWNAVVQATINTYLVTPYVGVWIETDKARDLMDDIQVTPYVGVWIETATSQVTGSSFGSHSLCGSVDWNITSPPVPIHCFGHSLCGSVDWNR